MIKSLNKQETGGNFLNLTNENTTVHTVCGLPRWLGGEEPTCQAGDLGSRRRSWVSKIPWRREREPTPVFSSGRFRGQRSLAGYGLRGRKEWDVTEQLNDIILNGKSVNAFSQRYLSGREDRKKKQRHLFSPLLLSTARKILARAIGQGK